LLGAHQKLGGDVVVLHRPLVTAHRGSSAEAPENTLAAFRLALEQRCDAIELDIHLSLDEAAVVCHDETLERTTNGTGAIAEKTAAELSAYDAGSWFSPAYAGERMPLLDEVLDLVPRTVAINIEIKSCRHPNVNRRLIELLESRDRLDSVFFSSFDHACMAAMKKLAPTARVGLLYEEGVVDYEAFFKEHGIQGYAVHPYHEYINREYVDKAARAGLQVYTWTVNDPGRMKEMIEAGVSGIITNHPKVLRELLEGTVG
jgi:glycerophosphoryl diester phosphodiesterase